MDAKVGCAVQCVCGLASCRAQAACVQCSRCTLQLRPHATRWTTEAERRASLVAGLPPQRSARLSLSCSATHQRAVPVQIMREYSQAELEEMASDEAYARGVLASLASAKVERCLKAKIGSLRQDKAQAEAASQVSCRAWWLHALLPAAHTLQERKAQVDAWASRVLCLLQHWPSAAGSLSCLTCRARASGTCSALKASWRATRGPAPHKAEHLLVCCRAPALLCGRLCRAEEERPCTCTVHCSATSIGLVTGSFAAVSRA